jgi:hypothetical protein
MSDQSQTAMLARESAAPDAEAARGVIVEILRQQLDQKESRLSRDDINHVFWLAHLHFARENRGFLTTWPILRIADGVEVFKVDAILTELVDDGLVEVEVIDAGPIPLSRYTCTAAGAARRLPDPASAAVSQALASMKDLCCRGYFRRHGSVSRAWRTTPEGEEMNIYIDLIPDDVYQARQRTLEEMTASSKDLFQ